MILPKAPGTPADDPVIAAQAARARTVYDQLRAGTLDRALLTANANYYFTPQAIADFQSSLAPLGEPTAFEPAGKPVLRGGFVIQGYHRQISRPHALDSVDLAEPGANGRIEQFLVTPAQDWPQ